MQPVSSILVVVDRSPAAADAVAKAVLLASKFKAHIELFMCDAERGYALSQAYVAAGVNEARQACNARMHQYLDSLRRLVSVPDVTITIDAACESPLYESIVRKVLRTRPDLVIKNAASGEGGVEVRFDTTDWQLMRTCPATLMLTRGRAWNVSPRFAAAIDASGAESAGVAHNILQAAKLVSGCTGGALELIYAEPFELTEEGRARASQTLHSLVDQIPGMASRVHVLVGTPEVCLPRFAAGRIYDAILLGALTHQPGYTAQVGTLTSKLVEALECDFILVKPSAYHSPIAESCVDRCRVA